MSGGICLGGICLGGICPRTVNTILLTLAYMCMYRLHEVKSSVV